MSRGVVGQLVVVPQDGQQGADDTPAEVVFKLIKKLDSGDGVDIEEVIKSSSYNNAEELIQKLMQAGDVFEVKPGRIKVLE